MWKEVWSLKFGGCRPSISLGKGYRLSSIREVWLLVPTRIIRIGIRVMGWPRLEVIHIGYMLTRGKGRRVPNLAIFSYMIMGTTSITSRGRVT